VVTASAIGDPPGEADPSRLRPVKVRSRPGAALLEPAILRRAALRAFVKLDPRLMAKIPVMFVVEIGSVITTVEFLARPDLFVGLVTAWLWATVLFANFAEAVAEGRGKAQADTLRQARKGTVARRLRGDGTTEVVPSAQLKAGDRCLVAAGEVIPGDGDVTEGVAMVDESAITGESAPVIRESGGDRCAVTGGTVVLSDQITVEITSSPGETFLDRMIALVEGASRQKTPNEVALDILIAGMTLILLVAVVTLQLMAVYDKAVQSTAVLVALFVCLAPTTIGGLLSAIGIAGMDRMVQRNVLAMSGRAVEAAGDCSTLLLDKTGTITYGNRMAAGLIPVRGVGQRELAEAALLSSAADETPEGRSIVDFTQERLPVITSDLASAQLVPFSAVTRMSGIDLPSPAKGRPARSIRKGAADSVRAWALGNGGTVPDDLAPIVEQVASGGGTPLVVADGPRILGVIYLKDTVKQGMTERFAQLREMGIRTVMITGDNPLTAKAIAAEAGVDDFLAEATPQDKLALIRREQRGGHLVAMTGDGTNDAPALAQADVGLAMNTGTQAAKEAGNMVDLDSNPTKLIEVVEVAKQLLITRGSLTTFSIANDVAKYFAIIPAMFVVAYPKLRVLNVMHLGSPHTAILAAVIYNALVIPALIPLALRGVKFKPRDGAAILRRNALVFGLGGITAPFAFIKLIDLILAGTGLR
jgi:potassium-transporting ATPase ATP-binding subunit